MVFSFKVLKQFRFQSIFYKYWKKFALIIVLPILILNTIIYISYNLSAHNKIYSSFFRSSSLRYDNVSRFFDSMDQTFTALSENPTISDFFTLDNRPFSEGHIDILSITNSYLYKNTQLYSIYLYKPSMSYVLSTNGGAPIDQFRDLKWFEEYQKNGTTNFVIHNKLFDYVSKNEQEILSFCYGVYHQNSLQGFIVLNCQLKVLDNMLSSSDNDCYYLTNSDGNVFYSNNRDNIGHAIDKQYNYPTPQTNIEFYKNSSYFSSSVKLMTKPISFVTITFLDTYSETVQMRALLFITILITLLLPTFLALYISSTFYRSIREIILSLNAFDSSSPIQVATNEINFITNQITTLSHKNQNIEKELAIRMSQLQKAQISALQLQFNQHFLFNTLNLIYVLSRYEAEGKSQTSTAITLLSDLLRISLDINQNIVPVSSEIAYAKKYIEIEQLKYENMFNITWDIDEEVYDYKIAKLCFQPIIENAIRHGLQPLENKDKKLIITGKIIDNIIEFHFIDNGVGFDKKILQQIQDRLDDTSKLSHSTHIGLTNVHYRINLLFGEEYGINISSSPFSGSDICLRIPKVRDIPFDGK